MFIKSADGACTSGPLDVILIYHNVNEGTFHPAVYMEAPMPGPVPDVGEASFVRLRSRMHHTAGFASLEEAQENIRTELQPRLGIRGDNIIYDPPFPWDGTIGDTLIVQNWRKSGHERPLSDVMATIAG